MDVYYTLYEYVHACINFYVHDAHVSCNTERDVHIYMHIYTSTAAKIDIHIQRDVLTNGSTIEKRTAFNYIHTYMQRKSASLQSRNSQYIPLEIRN